MKIEINTDTDSPAVLANVGKFLVIGYGSTQDLAALIAGGKPQPSAAAPAAPAIVPDAPVPVAVPIPPAPVADSAPTPDVDPAKVFGGVSVPAGTVPVPPAPAPLVPLVPGTTAADIERDTAGVPYDARIHNKSRTKKQDGTWKLAKGIDPAVVAAVLAEIKPASAPLPDPVPVPVPTATVTVPPVPAAVPMAPQSAPVDSGASSVAPTNAVGPVTFRGVMAKMNAAVAAGKFAKTDVDAMLAQLGLQPDGIATLVLPVNVTNLAAFDALLTAKGA
jgi:hypothetical protein